MSSLVLSVAVIVLLAVVLSVLILSAHDKVAGRDELLRAGQSPDADDRGAGRRAQGFTAWMGPDGGGGA